MFSCFLVPMGRILVFLALEALGNVCVCVSVRGEREMIWKEKFVGYQFLSMLA